MNRPAQSDFFDTETRNTENQRKIALLVLPMLAVIPITLVLLSECRGVPNHEASHTASLALDPASGENMALEAYKQDAGYDAKNSSFPPAELAETSALPSSKTNGSTNADPEKEPIDSTPPGVPDQIAATDPAASDSIASTSAKSVVTAESSPVGSTANPSKMSESTRKVQKGDTLYSIGKQHNRSPESIAGANGMNMNGVLREGQVLRVPSKREPAAAAVSYTAPPTRTSQPPVANLTPATHKVRPGETLYSIGNRYNRTPTAIARENQMKVDGVIHDGQNLQIPSNSQPTTFPTRSLVNNPTPQPRPVSTPIAWGGPQTPPA